MQNIIVIGIVSVLVVVEVVIITKNRRIRKISNNLAIATIEVSGVVLIR